MNKLNELGSQMLEYKSELNKDYPSIVINSLLGMVEKLAVDGVIDVDVHYALKEKDVNVDDLFALLMAKEPYVKTQEELMLEYEQIRLAVNEILEITDGDNEPIKTISSVQNEKIAIIKEFVITEEFIKNYFNIENQNKFDTLMKRKGFVEMFAILRLEKILKDFSKEKDLSNLKYETTYSNVFFEVERCIYGIHLLFNVSIENLEDEMDRDSLIHDIKSIISEADEYFEMKMKI